MIFSEPTAFLFELAGRCLDDEYASAYGFIRRFSALLDEQDRCSIDGEECGDFPVPIPLGWEPDPPGDPCPTDTALPCLTRIEETSQSAAHGCLRHAPARLSGPLCAHPNSQIHGDIDPLQR